MVEQIVKNDFIDWPPSNQKEIIFSNPPKLEGQFGMPVIIDKILGTIGCPIILKIHFFSRILGVFQKYDTLINRNTIY